MSYLRKEISTLLIISAAIALLLASPLVFSHFRLQPVQAQSTSLSFRTPTPANGMSTTQQGDMLTFDAQGTIAAASVNSQSPNVANITNGTIQLHYNNNTSYSGTITNGTFTNTTSGGDISFTAQVENQSYLVTTPCTAFDSNSIILTNGDLDQYFLGAVECSPSSQVGGGNTTTTTSTNTTTTQSSSMT